MTQTMDREIPRALLWRGRLRTTLVTALALAIGWGSLSWGIGLLEPSVRRARVRIGAVEQGPIEAVLNAAGTVQPAAEQVIPSLVEARILRVLHTPGDTVEIGEPLLELDVGAAALELARLGDELARERNSRLELELQLTERQGELAGARAAQQLDLDELHYRVQQDQRLFDQGLIPETQLRATRVRQQKAQIELERLTASVANHHASRTAQLAGRDARIATLGRQREDARAKAAMATVRADRGGVLTFVVDQLGTNVRPGDTLARIAEADRYRIEASIAEVHASRLTIGLPVRVPIDDTLLDGRVASIEPAVTGGAVRFHVALQDSAHRLLRPNLRTEVLVVVAERASGLRLGKGPFVGASGLQKVFVVDGDRAIRRTVRLGLSGHRHWEVLEGLERGEQVILSDVSRFLDQTDIRVKP